MTPDEVVAIGGVLYARTNGRGSFLAEVVATYRAPLGEVPEFAWVVAGRAISRKDPRHPDFNP